MGTITIAIDIVEETHSDGKISAMCHGWIEEDGEVNPATKRLANMLHEQMELALKVSQTTMNERV